MPPLVDIILHGRVVDNDTLFPHLMMGFWIHVIMPLQFFKLLKNVVTIYLFWNLQLQFFYLNRVILYVFDAFGLTRRPTYFSYYPKYPCCFSPSLTAALEHTQPSCRIVSIALIMLPYRIFGLCGTIINEREKKIGSHARPGVNT